MVQVPDPEPARCLRTQRAPTPVSPRGSRGREGDLPQSQAVSCSCCSSCSQGWALTARAQVKSEELSCDSRSRSLQSRDSFGRDSPRLSCPEVAACGTLACKGRAHCLPPASSGCQAGGQLGELAAFPSEIRTISSRHFAALKASAFPLGPFSSNKILKFSFESLPPWPECPTRPGYQSSASLLAGVNI